MKQRKRWIGFAILLMLGIMPLKASASEEPRVSSEKALVASEEPVVLRVAFPEVEGFTMKDKDGKRSGLVVDYLNEIAKYTGWEYEYIDVKNEDLIDAFLEGSFDLMGGTYYNESLSEYAAYPDYSCGNTKSYLLARWEDTFIRGNLFNLNGKTIGVYSRATENLSRLEMFLEVNKLECEIKLYDIEELVDGSLFYYLENGQVDLLLGNATDNNGTFKEVASFDSQPHYIVTQEGNQEILDELNRALGQILEANPLFSEKYYSSANSRTMVLNKEEQAYVQEKRTVTVAVPENFHPFYCVESTESGHNGIVPDMLHKIEEMSGLTFSYLLTDTYIEAVKMVQNEEADVLGFYLGSDEESAKAGFALTQPYITLVESVVRNEATVYPQEGLTYGLTEGRDIPSNIEGSVVYFADIRDALEAANQGEIDFVYGLSTHIEGEMQKVIYPNLKSVSFYNNSIDICFGVLRPADSYLLTIFNKAINCITEEERAAIGNTNLASLGQAGFTLRNFVYLNPVLTVVLMLIFCLFLIIIILISLRFRMRSMKIRSELKSAEETSRAKGQFLSQMSHEIRTPINGIMGMTELSKKHVNDPEQVGHYLDRIQISSQKLLTLVNEILEMSKLESGKVELEEVPFDLGKLLRSLCSDFSIQAEAKNIDFEIELQGQIESFLVGDSLRLNQILENLLSNAVKFTAGGGKITVAVKELSRKEDSVRMSFEVRDTGCGIAEENQERIFSAFEQENKGTTRKYGGTGLGLAITKDFVKLMQGEISVESKVNNGSCFRVEVPFRYREEEKKPCGEGQRILLVHSSKSTREYLTELLREENFSADAAETVEQAEETLGAANTAGNAYEMCLLEWKVSGETKAAESISKLCEASENKTTLILTGYDCEALADAAVQPQVEEILYQPVFRKDIVKLLEKHNTARQRQMISLKGCFRNLHILVVEDNEINREVVLGLLEETEASADYAVDGAMAVEKFAVSAEGYYDLILMDIQMPVMDGLSATRAIRALKRSDAGEVFIFAMSANALKADKEKCLESGMNAHIGKPFKLEEIYRRYREEKYKKRKGL